MTEESRRPFFEGLLPAEDPLDAPESWLLRCSSGLARLVKRLHRFMEKRNRRLRATHFRQVYADVEQLRDWPAASETSDVMQCQTRKPDVTLH